MRLALIVTLVLFLAACSPQEPSGFAVSAPPTDLDGRALVSAEVIGEQRGVPQVRITVRDDLVSPLLVIDDDGYKLGGREVQPGWLSDRGTLITRLAPGEHTLRAFSCQESFFEWRCGCVSKDDCGHWMEYEFNVPEPSDERRLGEDETYFP